MRHRAVFPSTVVVEPSRCCACCGNYCDDTRCTQCGLASPNAGEDSTTSSAPATSSYSGTAQAAGAGAGVLLVVLALLLSQQERLFS
jgi:hypothetical protein